VQACGVESARVARGAGKAMSSGRRGDITVGIRQSEPGAPGSRGKIGIDARHTVVEGQQARPKGQEQPVHGDRQRTLASPGWQAMDTKQQAG